MSAQNSILPKTICQKRFAKNQSGFTVVEILIVFIFVVAAIYIFLKFTDTFNRIGRSINQTSAYHVAAKKMEDLRNTPFASLSATGPFTDGNYQGQLTVTNYQGQTDIKQIKVEVFYQDHSTQKVIELDTLMSQYGLNP